MKGTADEAVPILFFPFREKTGTFLDRYKIRFIVVSWKKEG